MTPKREAALRAALVALREATAAAAPEKIEPNRKDATSVGVADEDEQALSEMIQTLASQRNRKRAALIGQIDRALRRFDEAPEDVGLCEDCGEEIPAKRLQLMPYVIRCADCQSELDPKRGLNRRSLTDFK